MKILDILPPKGALHAPHFRSRYEGMPDDYSFHILVTGDTALDGERFANATLHVQAPAEPWNLWTRTKRVAGLLARGIRLARREKVDVIVSYDPLTLGLIGSVIKLFSGAKLVVEINGHIRDAKSVTMAGEHAGFVKKTLFNLVGSLSLSMADCVKVLNREQIEEWQGVLGRKKVVMFHDYVPTHEFIPSEQDDRFFYCLGFPFQLKGVDILIDAFSRIREEFPEQRLVVMGHCREPELSRWQERAAQVPGVEIRKPIPYEEVAGYLSRCTALVVPSRTEGMGRVFIEAMACGKPCVGTRVGGIPNVIDDGVTGFVVNPEDPADLADRLRRLLADAELRKSMGEAGRRRAETLLSSGQYVSNFQTTMEQVLKDDSSANGLCFNGFDTESR